MTELNRRIVEFENLNNSHCQMGPANGGLWASCGAMGGQFATIFAVSSVYVFIPVLIGFTLCGYKVGSLVDGCSDPDRRAVINAASYECCAAESNLENYYENHVKNITPYMSILKDNKTSLGIRYIDKLYILDCS